MSTKLKSLERSLGLVPKQYPPMSQGMELIARQTERQAPAPEGGHDLGDAFDALLQQRIDEALAVERERHSAQVRQLMDQIKNQQPQRPPRIKKPEMEFISKVTHRDHFGRIWVTETVDPDGGKFIIEITGRDENGSITSSKTFPWIDKAPYKPNKSRLPDPRQYREPEPR